MALKGAAWQAASAVVPPERIPEKEAWFWAGLRGEPLQVFRSGAKIWVDAEIVQVGTEDGAVFIVIRFEETDSGLCRKKLKRNSPGMRLKVWPGEGAEEAEEASLCEEDPKCFFPCTSKGGRSPRREPEPEGEAIHPPQPKPHAWAAHAKEALRGLASKLDRRVPAAYEEDADEAMQLEAPDPNESLFTRDPRRHEESLCTRDPRRHEGGALQLQPVEDVKDVAEATHADDESEGRRIARERTLMDFGEYATLSERRTLDSWAQQQSLAAAAATAMPREEAQRCCGPQKEDAEVVAAGKAGGRQSGAEQLLAEQPRRSTGGHLEALGRPEEADTLTYSGTLQSWMVQDLGRERLSVSCGGDKLQGPADADEGARRSREADQAELTGSWIVQDLGKGRVSVTTPILGQMPGAQDASKEVPSNSLQVLAGGLMKPLRERDPWWAGRMGPEDISTDMPTEVLSESALEVLGPVASRLGALTEVLSESAPEFFGPVAARLGADVGTSLRAAIAT